MKKPDIRSVAPSLALLDEAVEQFDPIAVFGLFSGGHDSLTACHVASQHPKFTGCVHINTGIGIPQTRDFVYDTCKREGWKLREIRAKEDCGQDFEELVVERGFPGPPHHYKMYNRLKERALKLLTKETKVGHSVRAKILLVSGCRSQESTRRMGHVEPIQHRKEDGARVWVAVIHDWSKIECNDYMALNKLPRNAVVDTIHKSGECLCLAPETLVSTPDGWRQINEISEGDLVHNCTDGRLSAASVTEVHRSEAKPLVRVKPYFLRPIRATENHPIWVRRYKHRFENRTSVQDIGPPEFVSAGDLAAKYLENQSVSVWKKDLAYVGYPFRTESARLPLSDDQLRLLGYFVSDGCYNWRKDRQKVGGIVFTISASDEDFAARITAAIREGLGLNVHRRDWTDYRNGREYITIRNLAEASSNFIAEHVMGRYSEEKCFVGHVMTAPPDQQEVLLHALWRGDGSDYTVSRDGRTDESVRVYSTTSLRLAMQVQEMLLRAGEVYGVRTNRAMAAKNGICYQVGKSGSGKTRNGFIENGVLWATVQQVQEDEPSPTFNLTVAGEPNYLTEGGLVHNCGSFAIPPKDGEVRGEEFRELAMWYPEVAANIERIEMRVREAGFPWNWDERQPKWFLREQKGQAPLFDLAPDAPEPMCWSCNKRNEDQTDDAPTINIKGTDDAPQD